ncbi:hypothetical protein PYCC9005_002760 [Savitreella phatthalungensis]
MLSVPLCYATPSLGMHQSHSLERKLRAIRDAGFAACEIGMPDLENFAKSSGQSVEQIAPKVGLMCKQLDLKVLVLQPHSQFEGYQGAKHREKLERAERWIRLLSPLGCDMLQVGSNDDTDSSGDYRIIADTLRDLCDIASKYHCRIAYEPWCWGAHVNTWLHCYHVLQKVNRSNFGLCLDTFQQAGGEWADPGRDDGLLPKGEWTASLAQLAKIDPKHIFFLQISDAYRVHITPNHPDWTEDTPGAREIWSHSYRPLPFDQSRPGYLPVVDCIRAILATGFHGWFSYEVFLDEMKEESFNLEAFAQLAMESHRKVVRCIEQSG